MKRSFFVNLPAISFGLLASTMPSIASAQTSQPAPAEITPPAGNVAFLTAHATGTQNYICLPSASTDGASAWTFLAPQATLSITLNRFNQQVSTHFLSPAPIESPTAEPACTLSIDGKQLYCPTWQSSFDSSAVWGSRVASISAGSDPTCSNTGAIPCLLLKAVATRPGNVGNGLFSRTTYIQRLNTNGGSAPAGSCKVGSQALVRYTADYSFFAEEHKADTDTAP